MKIAIVNDVGLATEALRRAVTADGTHEVIWTAENGREAVDRCIARRPDLILMDLFMPEMDGVTATREIMARAPCAILIVTASVEDYAGQVFAAMGYGALDATNTPILGAQGVGKGCETFLNKIQMLEYLINPGRFARARSAAAAASRAETGIALLAFGASSGGPSALAEILGRIDPGISVPIVVIQHIDEQFAREFAAWLGRQTRLPVRTVQQPTTPVAGTVYVAERDNHLVLAEDGRLAYSDAAPASFYRPSVDVFFESVQRHSRGTCLAVLLTGMGRDGAEGLLHLRRAGHVTIAQDKATSAVYGMPRAAIEIGAAEQVLALSDIAPYINNRIRVAKRAGWTR